LTHGLQLTVDVVMFRYVRLPAADQTDVAYQEVKSVISVGRGVGLWGDMVVTLNNGDKVEIRALER
jgi:hypothetical protein